ncbi:MAG: hypothetical protein P1U57_11535 [Oleibacter sp.]|nr:hypothetical protein [Thalassolituus sp.]
MRFMVPLILFGMVTVTQADETKVMPMLDDEQLTETTISYGNRLPNSAMVPEDLADTAADDARLRSLDSKTETQPLSNLPISNIDTRSLSRPDSGAQVFGARQ